VESWDRSNVTVTVRRVGRQVVVTVTASSAKKTEVFLHRPDEAEELAAWFDVPAPEPVPTEQSRPAAWSAEAATQFPTVPPHRVVTLPDLHGHRITRVHGTVTAIGSLSGWTASHKGRGALNEAMLELRRAAAALHADAIVGVQVSAFGAAGGITNMVGGDAVGVLLAGTAVSTELTEGSL
jgi:uncharacterized protein YbjQ (UPF0145 family)